MSLIGVPEPDGAALREEVCDPHDPQFAVAGPVNSAPMTSSRNPGLQQAIRRRCSSTFSQLVRIPSTFRKAFTRRQARSSRTGLSSSNWFMAALRMTSTRLLVLLRWRCCSRSNPSDGAWVPGAEGIGFDVTWGRWEGRGSWERRRLVERGESAMESRQALTMSGVNSSTRMSPNGAE